MQTAYGLHGTIDLASEGRKSGEGKPMEISRQVLRGGPMALRFRPLRHELRNGISSCEIALFRSH
jgi:hypothetical protein